MIHRSWREFVAAPFPDGMGLPDAIPAIHVITEMLTPKGGCADPRFDPLDTTDGPDEGILEDREEEL